MTATRTPHGSQRNAPTEKVVTSSTRVEPRHFPARRSRQGPRVRSSLAAANSLGCNGPPGTLGQEREVIRKPQEPRLGISFLFCRGSAYTPRPACLSAFHLLFRADGEDKERRPALHHESRHLHRCSHAPPSMCCAIALLPCVTSVQIPRSRPTMTGTVPSVFLVTPAPIRSSTPAF